MPLQKQSPGIIRSFTLKGGSRESYRVAQKISVLRFETPDQLKCLRGIFGDSITFAGIRKRRPKLNYPDEIMQPLTKLNVIIGSEMNDENNTTYVDIFKCDYEYFICLYYDECIVSANGRRVTNQRTQENIIYNEYLDYMLTAIYT